jgi:hypothetical protein
MKTLLRKHQNKKKINSKKIKKKSWEPKEKLRMMQTL